MSLATYSPSWATACSTRCGRSLRHDAKALRATVSTFPKSEFYDIGELLTQIGIGEAAVTILSENGVPTPVVHTKLRAPTSRMAPADDVAAAANASPLFTKYGERVDAQSAREMLSARLEQSSAPAPQKPSAPDRAAPRPKGAPARRDTGDGGSDALGQGAAARGKFLKSRQGKSLKRQVARGVFGMLKKKL